MSLERVRDWFQSVFNAMLVIFLIMMAAVLLWHLPSYLHKAAAWARVYNDCVEQLPKADTLGDVLHGRLACRQSASRPVQGR